MGKVIIFETVEIVGPGGRSRVRKDQVASYLRRDGFRLAPADDPTPEAQANPEPEAEEILSPQQPEAVEADDGADEEPDVVDSAEEEEEEEEEPEDGFDDMSYRDLQALCVERDIPATGTRAQLLERLRS